MKVAWIILKPFLAAGVMIFLYNMLAGEANLLWTIVLALLIHGEIAGLPRNITQAVEELKAIRKPGVSTWREYT